MSMQRSKIHLDWKFINARDRLIYNLTYLDIILRRIRKEVRLITETELERGYNELRLDIESYFVFHRSIMDIFATLVPYFYSKHSKEIKSDSFEAKRNWYIKTNPQFDPEYTRYLKSMRWFVLLKESRDNMIHRRAFPLIYEEDGIITFNLVKGLKHITETIEVEYFFDLQIRNLFEFLEFYTDHFTKVVQDNFSNYQYTNFPSKISGLRELETIL